MRLTIKLTIGLVVAILPVIAVNSGVRVGREIDVSEADLRNDEVMLGRTVAGAMATVWQSAGEREAKLLVDGANKRQSRVEIRWVWLDVPRADQDAPVTEVAIAAPTSGEPLTVRARRPGDTIDSLFTYVAVTSPSGRRGAIEVRRSLTAEQSFIRNTIRHAAIATVAVVGLCGCLALGLGALLVGRPVNRLVAQARRIGAGDLAARAGLTHRDELGQLGAEFDTMCERLAEARSRVDVATRAKIAALDQLRHADRLATVGKLAAGIAHEIGTPLNVISGHAQLITTNHPPGSAEHDHASIVIQQTQRVASIIRQLLDFARRGAPRRTTLELAPLVRETVALLEPLAVARGVAIRLDLDPTCVGRVDHGQIQQAITNLAVNGVQAMRRGGQLVITLTRDFLRPPPDHGDVAADYAKIEISDTGIGIAADVLPHIFEPFFTTKAVGEGTGLGLSVTYGIVKDHDGWIAVTSKRGEGSRFAMFLPLAQDQTNKEELS